MKILQMPWGIMKDKKDFSARFWDPKYHFITTVTGKISLTTAPLTEMNYFCMFVSLIPTYALVLSHTKIT